MGMGIMASGLGWGFSWLLQRPTSPQYNIPAARIESVPPEQVPDLFFRFPERVDQAEELHKKYECNTLSTYTVLSLTDPLRSCLQELLTSPADNKDFSEEEKRALACMMGMAVGDALGAPLEFLPLRYDHIFLRGFDEEASARSRFSLIPGQWTDDTSMGLCLGESLLVEPEFDPFDLRVRFLNWWYFGYRNAFGSFKGLRRSIGLGGCIGMSFSEFLQEKSEYTIAGDHMTSGNGSIMRLAAVPVCYHDQLEKALDVAYKQSKTTHQGDEAAECCRLMTQIIVELIHADNALSPQQRKEAVLGTISDRFETTLYSVQCLAQAKCEETDESNKNLDLSDRQWNWKEDGFRYSHTRATEQPGYIGSYCMDGLAMALHCVWSTNTFTEALIKVINLRGDADTVGSITGQMAGALYGIEEIPVEWIRTIQKWDREGDILLTAAKLFRHETISIKSTN